MKRITLILPALFIILTFNWSCHKPLSTGVDSQKKTSSAGLQEFHQRDGLPNFFQKINEGQEVNVAYFGGSITEAAEGWRSLTFNYLRIKYPHTSFNEINATIGGTGSNLGVFRMERDVLAYKPDLVFVEFAVNDAGRTTEQIYQSMEGIVRKTWQANPNADICFVYTLAENVLPDLLAGTYQPSAQAMEKIADYYKIPSIHMGVEVARLNKEGKLIFTGKPEEHPGKIVFTTDKTHPLSKSGHPVYASVVRKYLDEMGNVVGKQAHSLPKAFVANNWERAQLVTLPETAPSAHWQKLPADHELTRSFSKSMPIIYRAIAPDAVLHVKFKGTTIGFYDIMGPKTGILEVTLDGEKKENQRFDAFSHYYRKNSFYMEGLPDSVHEVTIRVPGTAFDKVAILQKRNIKMDDPSRYAENGWYLGNLLLVGKFTIAPTELIAPGVRRKPGYGSFAYHLTLSLPARCPSNSFSMKVAGFSFIRNAVQYDYPIIEAITSVLPLCDEFVIAVGDSDDDTLGLIEAIPSDKIRIIRTTWDDSARAGGKVLALETDKALAAISPDTDWAFYIQGDEVLHEKSIPVVQEAMQRYLNDPTVEGLLFKYLHFYGSYSYVGDSRRWYRREIRVIRNTGNVVSYKDAQGFRTRDNRKLKVKLIDAYIYHYGWVKPPETQKKRLRNANHFWNTSETIAKADASVDAFDYSQIDSLAHFTGTHPSVMQPRVDRLNWPFTFDTSQKRYTARVRLLTFIEKLTGWRIGEYKNYKL